LIRVKRKRVAEPAEHFVVESVPLPAEKKPSLAALVGGVSLADQEEGANATDCAGAAAPNEAPPCRTPPPASAASRKRRLFKRVAIKEVMALASSEAMKVKRRGTSGSCQGKARHKLLQGARYSSEPEQKASMGVKRKAHETKPDEWELLHAVDITRDGEEAGTAAKHSGETAAGDGQLYCNGAAMVRERVEPASQQLSAEDEEWVFDYYVEDEDGDGGSESDSTPPGYEKIEVLTIGYLDDAGELVFDEDVDSDDDLEADDGSDHGDAQEWDYPENDPDDVDDDDDDWQDDVHPQYGTRVLSDDDEDVGIYADSMFQDREKYQHSAYMSDSDESDIEADPEYQRYVLQQGDSMAGPWQMRA